MKIPVFTRGKTAIIFALCSVYYHSIYMLSMESNITNLFTNSIIVNILPLVAVYLYNLIFQFPSVTFLPLV